MQVKRILKNNNKRKLSLALLALTGATVVIAPISIAASCAAADIVSFNDADIKTEAEKAKIEAYEAVDGALPEVTVGTSKVKAQAPTLAVISTLTTVHWSNVPRIPARWAGTFEKFEYLKGNFATEELAVAQTSWVDELPTSFIKTDYLWARPVIMPNYKNPLEGTSQFELGTGFKAYNLTDTSGLKALQTADPQFALPTKLSYNLSTDQGGGKALATYIGGTANPFRLGDSFYVSFKPNEPTVANRKYDPTNVTSTTTTANGQTTTTYTAQILPKDPTIDDILFRQLTLSVEYLVGSGANYDSVAKATALTTGWSDTLPSKLFDKPASETWDKGTATTLVPTLYVYARVNPIGGITFTNNVIDLTSTLGLRNKVIALLPEAPAPTPTVTPANP